MRNPTTTLRAKPVEIAAGSFPGAGHAIAALFVVVARNPNRLKSGRLPAVAGGG